MKLFFFSVYLLLLSSICFTDTIDVLQPYQSDSIIINNPYGSLIFSNGIVFRFIRFSGGTLEDSYELISAVIENHQRAGFKYSPNANYVNVKPKPSSFALNISNDSMKFYSNMDTNWEKSDFFPDSLIPLDLVFNGYDYGDSLSHFSGKWVMQRQYSMSTAYPLFESPLEGFNNIIYIQTNYNKIKLQICNMNFIDKVVTPGAERTLVSMTIKWASDSLGNGRFVIPIYIRPVVLPNLSRFNDKINYPQLFNLIGQRSNKSKNYQLPSGVYVLYCNNNKDMHKNKITIGH